MYIDLSDLSELQFPFLLNGNNNNSNPCWQGIKIRWDIYEESALQTLRLLSGHNPEEMESIRQSGESLITVIAACVCIVRQSSKQPLSNISFDLGNILGGLSA